MILVYEPNSRRRLEYYRIMEELAEQVEVAMTLAELVNWLNDSSKPVDLVIGELEIAADQTSVVTSELVQKYRPEAALLTVTHEAGQSGLLSTASDNFPTEFKRAVKGALTNRLVRAIVAAVRHNVNNLAAVVLGNAELVMGQHGEHIPDSAKERMAIIIQKAAEIGNFTGLLSRLNPDNAQIKLLGGVPMIVLSEAPQE